MSCLTEHLYYCRSGTTAGRRAVALELKSSRLAYREAAVKGLNVGIVRRDVYVVTLDSHVWSLRASPFRVAVVILPVSPPIRSCSLLDVCVKNAVA